MPTFRPRSSVRGRYRYAELALAPGPATLASTGDNSYGVLFGHEWAVELRADDDELHAYQRQGDGSWLEITSADLPPVFGVAHPDARRVTFAFDQSARMVIALEMAGSIEVTRWDSGAGVYKQNVTVAGRDPALLIDAAMTYRVAGSDVLLFYLSPDRERLLCRVQREIYATEHEIHDFGHAAILDRVLPLPFQYAALASDAAGLPLRDAAGLTALVSDPSPYLGTDELAGGVTPAGPYAHRQERVYHDDADALDGGAAMLTTFVYTGSEAFVDAEPDALDGGAAMLTTFVYTGSEAFVDAEPDALDGGAAMLADAWDYRQARVYEDAEPEAINGGVNVLPTYTYREA